MINKTVFTRLSTMSILMVAVLSGCTMFGNRGPEYLEAQEAQPLKIPEGMDKPRGLRPVVINLPPMRMPAGDELEPMPPRVVSTAGKKDAYAYLAWSADGVYMLVKDNPDIVSGKLAGVIAKEDSLVTLQGDEATGSHKFHYEQPDLTDEGFFSHMAFWRNDPLNFSGIFMTQLRPDGDDTRVYLRFGDGGQVDTQGAEHVLAVFMDELS